MCSTGSAAISTPAKTSTRRSGTSSQVLTAWQARHGLTLAQYQSTFDQLVAQGYRLELVSGYSAAGQDRIADLDEIRGIDGASFTAEAAAVAG